VGEHGSTRDFGEAILIISENGKVEGGDGS
jgi:hypothetical protein